MKEEAIESAQRIFEHFAAHMLVKTGRIVNAELIAEECFELAEGFMKAAKRKKHNARPGS